MMGRTHVLTGATIFGLATPILRRAMHLRPAELILGTVVCAGAAVLPDIDHPGSGISRTLGPLTHGFAWLVARTSGGHRRGTHSLTGVAVITLLTFTATALYADSPAWFAAGLGLAVMLSAAGFLAAAGRSDEPTRGVPPARRPDGTVWLSAAAVALALAVAALLRPHQAGLVLLGALLILVLSATARVVNTRRLLGLRREWDDLLPAPVTLALLHYGADLRVVPLAVLLGVVVHIAGDMITLGGCPLGWPWSSAMRGPKWFRTNSPVETGPIFMACVVVFVATIGWNTGVLNLMGA